LWQGVVDHCDGENRVHDEKSDENLEKLANGSIFKQLADEQQKHRDDHTRRLIREAFDQYILPRIKLMSEQLAELNTDVAALQQAQADLANAVAAENTALAGALEEITQLSNAALSSGTVIRATDLQAPLATMEASIAAIKQVTASVLAATPTPPAVPPVVVPPTNSGPATVTLGTSGTVQTAQGLGEVITPPAS
jgi:hypothetical protein